MEFRLLGPIEATINGRSVLLGGAKPRALMASLLLEPGRVVSVDRLVDIVWTEDPPQTARAVIQTYIKNLRRAFDKVGARGVIATRMPGYLIQVPASTIDSHRFQSLLIESRQADLRRRIMMLRQAEALWRGPAMAGLGSTLLAAEASRLDALRLTATEERIAAALALGEHDHLAELTALVERHSTNERLRSYLMTTLYALGRQADALATYRAGRKVLVDELGVEPGPEIKALHSAILRGDLAAAAQPTAATQRRVPTQLPPAQVDFTGRSEFLANLTKPGAATRVISGPGGSGKSSLAIRAATQIAASYPDGRLYAELRGMHEIPVTPFDVLGRFLGALGVHDDRIPDSVEGRTEIYRATLSGRAVLIVLDDARNEQHVRPLLPANPDCMTIITSRDRLAGLEGSALTELGVLSGLESIELLSRLVGEERLTSDPVSAEQILSHCGGLPLAIRIAGARLVARQRWPLKVLADRLANESRRLNELASGDLEVRTTIELSYRALDPMERATLRRLGHVGLPDFSTWVVGWLMDIPKAAADPVIESLVDAQIADYLGVDEFGNLRYRLHDLVRLYARERAEAEDPAEDLIASVARTLSGWLSLMDQVGGASPPQEVSWKQRTRKPYSVSEQMAARVSADPANWFAAEQPSLIAGVERAAALGLHELACEFASTRYGSIVSGTNRFEVAKRINEAVLSSARVAGDVRTEAIMLAECAKLCYHQDKYAQARSYYNEALARFREIKDVRGQAAALAGLGASCREPGYLTESLHFLDQAAALLSELDDHAGYAYAVRHSASVRLELGDFVGTLADLDNALLAYRKVGNRRGEAFTLRTFGLYYRARADLLAANEACRTSIEIFRELGEEHMEAYAARALAKTMIRQGTGDEALAPLEWGLGICQSLGDKWGQAATLRVLGELHLDYGRLELAETYLMAARDIWASIDAALWLARTERDLAILNRARGDQEEARLLFDRALAVFRDRGAREYREIMDGAQTVTANFQ